MGSVAAFLSIAMGKTDSPQHRKFGLWIAVGLLFGAGGDVCLQLDDQSDSFFLPGLASFLIGHIAYIVGMWYGGIRLSAWSVAPMLVVVGGLLTVLLPKVDSDLVGPVAAYAATIGAMGAAALAWEGEEGIKSFLLIGSLSFVVSDSILAFDRFHTQLPSSFFLVMVTYYAAQFCFAWAAMEASDLVVKNKKS